jgi:hypothetical protein
VATIRGELCRQHAVALEAELTAEATGVIGVIDRLITGSGVKQAIEDMVAGAIGSWGRHGSPLPGSSSSPGSPPRPGSSTPPRTPPPAPRTDSKLAAARELLGFEPQEKLTIEAVNARRKALATVFHPDRAGGSVERMKRVNAAADLLVASLA